MSLKPRSILLKRFRWRFMDSCIDHDRQVVGQALGNNPKDLLMDLLTLISMFNRTKGPPVPSELILP